MVLIRGILNVPKGGAKCTRARIHRGVNFILVSTISSELLSKNELCFMPFLLSKENNLKVVCVILKKIKLEVDRISNWPDIYQANYPAGRITYIRSNIQLDTGYQAVYRISSLRFLASY